MNRKSVGRVAIVLLGGLLLAGCASTSKFTKLMEDKETGLYLSADEQEFLRHKTPEERARILDEQRKLLADGELQQYRQNKLLLGQPVTTGTPDSKALTQLNPATDMLNQSQERTTGPLGMEITAQNQLRADRKVVVDKRTGQVVETKVGVHYQSNGRGGTSPTVVPTNTVSQKALGRTLVENMTMGIAHGAITQVIANEGGCGDNCGGNTTLNVQGGAAVSNAVNRNASAIEATVGGCGSGGCW